MSKKDIILEALENRIKNIRIGDNVNLPSGDIYTYQNEIGYIDRQFINLTREQVETAPMPFVLINNYHEDIKTLIGFDMVHKVILDIVGFVKVKNDNEKLDTEMNKLQNDLLVAILLNGNLDNTCDFIVPVSITTVDEMIYPYGGFQIRVVAEYSTKGLNF